MKTQTGWALGGSSIRGVLPSKYARSGHYGVFCLQNLKVFTLRFLKYSVGKSAKNRKVQFLSTLPRECARFRHYGVFCLHNLKVFTLRILKNYVGKVDHFAILIINLTIFQNCDIVDLDSHHDLCVLLHFSKIGGGGTF